MDKSIIITEADIVKRFDEMCAESLNPDHYSYLVEEIIPQLQNTRQALLKKPKKEWLQTDGCGCTYWRIDGKKVIEKCELHKKDPNAFGGLTIAK